jgi:N,N'-diacetyllegionaminate synthase
VNHNGDLAMAHALIDAAVAAGADAVKFQTFKSERVVSPAAPKANYQLQTTSHAESQAEMIRRLELREEDHHVLMEYCAQRGILFLSTPFDEESVDLLSRLGVAAFKTSSGDVNNLPFLEHLARTGQPIVFSTGMSHLAEVEEAMGAMSRAGGRSIIILHCVSDYPTNPLDVNLRAMDTLAAAFPVPIGFSDHTLGTHVAIAAVARGACCIEKHLTLDRTLPGPDHRASLEPAELTQMIAAIRETEAALGDGVKQPRGGEIANIAIARKSLHWRRAVEAGQVVSADDFIALRPGSGLSPGRLRSLLGRHTAASVSAGALVRDEDFPA